ncbi:hypothetical protein LO762_08870 [Actinocorallia sp. API 0066]|uniref:hypothetical protein n=1 Tax=Actinocorallia sp. API 0066 TaxID=2896846 RepID=UPI001E6077A6|nr:hypothetical protein [Actinocorallia sp. API 0066]MCD0449298.1 hypothetical protein [Actinocorallia sp. API 0066]
MGDHIEIGKLNAINSAVGGTGHILSGDGRVEAAAADTELTRRLTELSLALIAELERRSPDDVAEAEESHRELVEGRPGRLQVLVKRLALGGTAFTSIAEIRSALEQLGF